MAGLQVEYLEGLAPERRRRILSRSQEDVSQVQDTVRKTLERLRQVGDEENLRQHGLKPGYTAADLEVKEEEIQAAYRAIDPKVLEALKAAAANIAKFHQAQMEREMWAVELATRPPGRALDPPPGPGGLLYPRRAWRLIPPAP